MPDHTDLRRRPVPVIAAHNLRDALIVARATVGVGICIGGGIDGGVARRRSALDRRASRGASTTLRVDARWRWRCARRTGRGGGVGVSRPADSSVGLLCGPVLRVKHGVQARADKLDEPKHGAYCHGVRDHQRITVLPSTLRGNGK